MNKRHKHYDLIVAWAKNPTRIIQFKRAEWDIWYDLTVPHWDDCYEYRIKPEPKPDIAKMGIAIFFKARQALLR